MADIDNVRRILLATFVLGSIGTGAELLLLEHTEDVWQKVPLGLIAAGCAAAALVAIRPAVATLALFRLAMALFVASGAVGVWLHYEGNAEFERELSPGIGGMALAREALSGATPALAPGTMVLLGVIGLTAAYRHPAGAPVEGRTAETRQHGEDLSA
jgi:hypothetical protein